MHNRLHRFLLVLLGFFFWMGSGAIVLAQDEHEGTVNEETEVIQGAENTGLEGHETLQGVENAESADHEAVQHEEGGESEGFSPGDFNW